MQDGQQWLTQNLNINIPGSYCYNDPVENCSMYGHLYNWESAKNGCEMLGEGWRLPTNEEWEQMAKHYGGIRIDSIQDGKEAYKRLIEGGNSEFNILFGGTRDPSGGYRRVEAHGFFWTATEYDSAHAWFYNLGKGGQFVNRHNDGEKAPGGFGALYQEVRSKPSLPAEARLRFA
jgi:uncharacterized protein (TIGR02145 family)